MSKEKQIDGATLAVLNCYRNKYYADGNNTEQGIVANAINDVLPTLVEFKNGCYRKQSEGEWVDKPTGAYSRMQSWCSACGKHSGIGGIESNRHKPFCPNCGAKMKGA